MSLLTFLSPLWCASVQSFCSVWLRMKWFRAWIGAVLLPLFNFSGLLTGSFASTSIWLITPAKCGHYRHKKSMNLSNKLVTTLATLSAIFVLSLDEHWTAAKLEMICALANALTRCTIRFFMFIFSVFWFYNRKHTLVCGFLWTNDAQEIPGKTQGKGILAFSAMQVIRGWRIDAEQLRNGDSILKLLVPLTLSSSPTSSAFVAKLLRYNYHNLSWLFVV